MMILIDVHSAALAARHLHAEFSQEISRRRVGWGAGRTAGEVPGLATARSSLKNWVRSVRGHTAPESTSSC